MDPKSVQNLANSLLSRLDMFDKNNECAKVLSGGMKRRLSVILAIIGDPK